MIVSASAPYPGCACNSVTGFAAQANQQSGSYQVLCAPYEGQETNHKTPVHISLLINSLGLVLSAACCFADSVDFLFAS